MGRQKKGRCVRKNKQIDSKEPDDIVRAPHSFVIHRGLPGDHIVELTKDFRRVLEPFTASALKERKRNTIKDFVSISSYLHVSHMCIFSKTELGMYLKLCRIPRGPTLTFKIINFTLARDVISALKKQMVFEEAFKNFPLVILNNFSGAAGKDEDNKDNVLNGDDDEEENDAHIKLMATTFQNMFPSINITKINLSTVRRCVCLNYNPADKSIDFRHYAIKVVPVGLSRGVKKLVQAKIPNLAKCQDYSEFLTKATLSESEAEDDPESHVTLSQKLSSRGNHAKGKSAIRLYELGPRITMQLMKVEDGLLDGQVMFHENIHKTEEEIKKIAKSREKKQRLKEKRKRTQEENKLKKEALKEEHKEKSLEGIKKKQEKVKKESDILMRKYAKESVQDTQQEDDDDAQYYRDEVGEEPDKDLFQRKSSVKRKTDYTPNYKPKGKKMKFNNDGKKPKSKRVKFSNDVKK
ncbi:protein Peter pan [Microplitis mediator]|uniref:protein Peter pan n=1 Tax=Microplitis mediator TaxID=375433 RepID=UPI002557117C|nr:protein Peter pan [Microplitis mediator]